MALENERKLNELRPKDIIKGVVVIYKERGVPEGRGPYPVRVYAPHRTLQGPVWKTEKVLGTATNLTFPSDKAKELNCYYIDDTGDYIYEGSWEGKLVPNHLVNLELLALLVLKEEQLK